MLRFILGRLGYGLLTVWFIATATFAGMHAVPGDPLLDARAVAPEIRRNLEARYGLDQPLALQYLRYLGNMARGDFGVSFTQQNREVNDIIREHFPVSALLGVLAIGFAALGGVFWGVITARTAGRWPDALVMFLVVLCISVPGFVLAALAQLGVLRLNAWAGVSLLPVAGWGGPAHMLVPALVLGLGTMAFLTRLMRTSMLEVRGAAYVRTARAKGLSETVVVIKHALRNALTPVITLGALELGTLLSGAVLTEQVFTIPGFGKLIIDAVFNRDYAVVQGVVLVTATAYILLNLMADMAYFVFNPRLRH